MIEFKNKIVQLGFGAVGKSFFEKVANEIKYDEEKYFVISNNRLEYTYFVEMGGKLGNFVVANICRENFKEIFNKYLNEGDLLIDFADSVGTRDFLEWCAYNNVMYLNTGETDWADNWYNILDENLKKNELRKKIKQKNDVNRYPIVLQHGNNPGLVSHFLKAGLEYIVKKQFKDDEKLNELLRQNKFNMLARELDLREIHVNDNDCQDVKDKFYEDKLYSTWSIDSFFFEMISEATANIGTDEIIIHEDKYKRIDIENGFLEFKDIAVDKVAKTYYPKGSFKAYLVPHEETITIAKSLEIEEDGKVVYRPTVIFLYLPCDFAMKYLNSARINDCIEFDKDESKITAKEVFKGVRYPKRAEILYREQIKSGTEYVGVLLLGSKFNPVWVGNRIKSNFLYKDKKTSYWQTPTITPVAMSALAAVCWMIKNKEKGGIYFPDDIAEYKEIISFAEKYISKTIYKTFNKKRIESKLDIDLNNLQLNDILT